MAPDVTRCTVAMALAAALPASAVTLNPDGLGQALIYPYYTAQSTGNDAFNTYISVVNHTGDAKALRVRFREGRLGKETLSFNLFLSPNDVWTAAVVPTTDGARLLTTDKSCTLPAIPAAAGQAPSIDFRNYAYAGPSDDGAGTGLDRSREGFLEMIEMATLTGASAAAVTHNSAGVPANCGAMVSGTPLVAAPSGGLSGTLTLINVASGLDFTVNAEALDTLSQQAFYRDLTQASVDFNSPEIDAVSVVSANGRTYRSVWSRPVDAVSSVLMRDHAMFEYILDQPTASLTDVVMTFPTRHFYVTPSSASAPFSAAARWAPNCTLDSTTRVGEAPSVAYWGREEQSALNGGGNVGIPPPAPPRAAICASSAVSTVRNSALTQMPREIGATPVFGSATGGLMGEGNATGPVIFVTASFSAFSSGWIDIRMPTGAVLASAAQSTRLDHGSGSVNTGANTFTGLPVVGFSARIFRNGTLRCDAGACQGNYGGAFPFTYRRNVAPSP